MSVSGRRRAVKPPTTDSAPITTSGSTRLLEPWGGYLRLNKYSGALRKYKCTWKVVRDNLKSDYFVYQLVCMDLKLSIRRNCTRHKREKSSVFVYLLTRYV